MEDLSAALNATSEVMAQNGEEAEKKVLMVPSDTFQGEFEVKNGSGSWIRTSDQVVNS